MKKQHHFWALLFMGYTFFLLFYSSSSCAAEKLSPPDITVEEPDNIALNQLFSWTTNFPRELIELQNRLKNDKALKEVEEELHGISKEIDQLKWDVTILQTTPNVNVQQVSLFVAKVQKLSSRLRKHINLMTTSIGFFSEQRKIWLTRKLQVKEIGELEEISIPMAKEMHEILIKTVSDALLPLEKQLNLVLTIGKALADLQIVLFSIDNDLQILDDELKSTSVHKTAPSLLAFDLYSRLNSSLFFHSYDKAKVFLSNLLENLKNNKLLFLLSIFVFGLISLTVFKSRETTLEGSRWYPFANHPVATAVFIVSSINAALGMLTFTNDLPQQWETLLHIVTLLAVIRLTKHLLKDARSRRMIIRLTSFLAVSMTLFLLGLEHVIIFLYVFFVSLLFLFYYFKQLYKTKDRKSRGLWLRRLWGLLPAAVIVFGLTGYDQLSLLAFSVFSGTIVALLIIWILYLLHLGLLEQFLLIMPFSLLRENTAVIVKNLQPLVALLYVLLLIAVECVVWNVYPTVNTALTAVSNFGLDVFGLHITPGFVFAIIFVIYVAVLASRAVESVLLNRVLPRYKVEKGVQLSITRLIHYSILFIGFCVLLRVLGFELNQLALLGGALGVGIGFGLQAIVNNFASGLILLFERPVKVGDTIQLGTEFGEVKSLGLRATIIQTFDNAEIVVPNSDLITAQVTNWTLANRKVRVKVPVGVAYGTDVSRVMEILLNCAKENPMVLSTPKATALFLAFGSSSLDFELRVWIPEFLDKLQVLSDLNQDIENEFALHGIEVPFPQSDIHLRSVDREAVLNFSGSKADLNGDETQ